MKKNVVIPVVLAAATLAGCASNGQPHDHSDLVNRIERAERAAAEAQEAARRAQARADEAAAMAQSSDDKIDRAFKKSQQK